jgi:hypothetical protein
MPPSDPIPRWRDLAEEAFLGMRAWRAAHPRATWAEIEAALAARLAALQGQVLQDVAHASPAADFRGADERPPCPHCGTPLQAAGQERRHLTTCHDHPLVLERTDGRCPRCGAGVFPPR